MQRMKWLPKIFVKVDNFRSIAVLTNYIMIYFTNFKGKVSQAGYSFTEILITCSNNNNIYLYLFFFQRFDQKCQFGSLAHSNCFLILLFTKPKFENMLLTPVDVDLAIINCSIMKNSFDKMQSFNTEKDCHQSKVFTFFTTLSSSKGPLNGSECTINFKRLCIFEVFFEKFNWFNFFGLYLSFLVEIVETIDMPKNALVSKPGHTCFWSILFTIDFLQLWGTLFSFRSFSSFFHIATASAILLLFF